jgi:hypothetical protein
MLIREKQGYGKLISMINFSDDLRQSQFTETKSTHATILYGEDNDDAVFETFCDDENDINGDDREHAGIHSKIFFFSTHRNNAAEIDPSYK